MLKRWGLILLILPQLWACKPVQEAQKELKKGATTTIDQAERAKIQGDLTAVTAALQTYFVENSKYPATLAELKLDLYHPEDLSYDPKTGQVRSKSHPDL